MCFLTVCWAASPVPVTDSRNVRYSLSKANSHTHLIGPVCTSSDDDDDDDDDEHNKQCNHSAVIDLDEAQYVPKL